MKLKKAVAVLTASCFSYSSTVGAVPWDFNRRSYTQQEPASAGFMPSYEVFARDGRMKNMAAGYEEARRVSEHFRKIFREQAPQQTYQTIFQNNRQIQEDQAQLKYEMLRARARAQGQGTSRMVQTDGRIVTSKNGVVTMVENERVTDASGRTYVRNTREMSYNDKKLLTSYKVENVYADGRKEYLEWQEGAYSQDSNAFDEKSKKLLKFKEKITDDQGNVSFREWDASSYDQKGRLQAYRETRTDSFGQKTSVERTESHYDGDDRLTGFKEKFTDAFGQVNLRERTDIEYRKNPRYEKDGKVQREEYLTTAYKETQTDPDGNKTNITWKDAQYNTKDQLTSYTEQTVDSKGQKTLKEWSEGTYDDQGNLSAYQETTTDARGRKTTLHWAGRLYDSSGQLLAYQETVTDHLGNTVNRHVSERTFNGRKQLVSYKEETRDAKGNDSKKVWTASRFDDKGRLVQYTEEQTDAQGHKTVVNHTEKSWDARGRTSAFNEEVTDVFGKTTRKERTGIGYDGFGRVAAYREETTNPLGKSTVVEWAEPQFNEYDELLSYQTKSTDAYGNATLTRWKAVRYDDAGRLAAYSETETDAWGKTSTRSRKDQIFNAAGDLLSYEEETKDSAGLTNHKSWSEGQYDQQGRLTGYKETLLQENQAQNYRQKTQNTRRDMAYDDYGRLIGFQELSETEKGKGSEKVRETSTRTWSDAAYDLYGRTLWYKEEIVSSIASRESRVTSHVLKEWTQGTYNEAGDLTGYKEKIKTTAQNERGEKIQDAETTTERSSILYNAKGQVTGYRDTISTNSGESPTQVVMQDMKYGSDGQMEGYTQLVHHGAVTTTTERTHKARDALGQVTQYSEKTWDSVHPQLITSNEVTLTHNSAGQVERSVTKTQGPEGSVTLQTRSSIVTNALDQAVAWNQETTSSDAKDLETRSHITVGYDLYGRQSAVEENGRRIGQQGQSLNERFVFKREGLIYDAQGRAVAWNQTSVSSAAQALNTSSRVQVVYNDSNEQVSYSEKGMRRSLSGSFQEAYSWEKIGIRYNGKNQAVDWKESRSSSREADLFTESTVRVTYDPEGRQASVLEKGVKLSRSQSDYKEEYEQLRADMVYNTLGQAVRWRETAWSSFQPEGLANESRVEAAYDIEGREVSRLENVARLNRSDGSVRENVTIKKDGIRYDSLGQTAGYYQEQNSSISSQLVTRSWVALGYNNLGQQSSYEERGSRESLDGVTYQESYSVRKTNMVTNLLGQTVRWTEESTSSQSPNLKVVTENEASYDAQGREKTVSERGVRQSFQGKPYSEAFTNEKKDFERDAFGQVIGWKQKSVSSSTPDQIVESEFKAGYDSSGRQIRLSEDGVRSSLDGSSHEAFQNQKANTAFDDLGRATAYDQTSHSSFDPLVTQHNRVTVSYNKAGQADSITEDGRKVSQDNRELENHKLVKTNILYDGLGQAASWNQTLSSSQTGPQITASRITQTYDRVGRVESSAEEGRRYTLDGRLDEGFRFRKSGMETNALGQTVAWDQESTSSQSPDLLSKSRVSVSYDDHNRLSSYREDTVKTSSNGRTPYYETSVYEKTSIVYDEDNNATNWDQTSRTSLEPAIVTSAKVQQSYDSKGRVTSSKETTRKTGESAGQSFAETLVVQKDTFEYDDLGRAIGFAQKSESSRNPSQNSDAHVTLSYDVQGRTLNTSEKGTRGQEGYAFEKSDIRYNGLGQAERWTQTATSSFAKDLLNRSEMVVSYDSRGREREVVETAQKINLAVSEDRVMETVVTKKSGFTVNDLGQVTGYRQEQTSSLSPSLVVKSRITQRYDGEGRENYYSEEGQRLGTGASRLSEDYRLERTNMALNDQGQMTSWTDKTWSSGMSQVVTITRYTAEYAGGQQSSITEESEKRNASTDAVIETSKVEKTDVAHDDLGRAWKWDQVSSGSSVPVMTTASHIEVRYNAHGQESERSENGTRRSPKDPSYNVAFESVQSEMAYNDLGQLASYKRSGKDGSAPGKTTREEVSLSYDQHNRLYSNESRIHETGEGLDRSYSVKTIFESYNTTGQAIHSQRTTWADSAAPDKRTHESIETVYRPDGLVASTRTSFHESGQGLSHSWREDASYQDYDDLGRARQYVRTSRDDSGAPDKTTVDMVDQTYDSQGRVTNATVVSTERGPGFERSFTTETHSEDFNLMGQAQKTTRVTTDDSSRPDITQRDVITNQYDAQGRAVVTSVHTEENGKDYSRSYDTKTVVIDYDGMGRQSKADRTTRNDTQSPDLVRVETLSTTYDQHNRVQTSRSDWNESGKTDDGKVLDHSGVTVTEYAVYDALGRASTLVKRHTDDSGASDKVVVESASLKYDAQGRVMMSDSFFLEQGPSGTLNHSYSVKTEWGAYDGNGFQTGSKRTISQDSGAPGRVTVETMGDIVTDSLGRQTGYKSVSTDNTSSDPVTITRKNITYNSLGQVEDYGDYDHDALARLDTLIQEQSVFETGELKEIAAALKKVDETLADKVLSIDTALKQGQIDFNQAKDKLDAAIKTLNDELTALDHKKEVFSAFENDLSKNGILFTWQGQDYAIRLSGDSLDIQQYTPSRWVSPDSPPKRGGLEPFLEFMGTDLSEILGKPRSSINSDLENSLQNYHEQAQSFLDPGVRQSPSFRNRQSVPENYDTLKKKADDQAKSLTDQKDELQKAWDKKSTSLQNDRTAAESWAKKDTEDLQARETLLKQTVQDNQAAWESRREKIQTEQLTQKVSNITYDKNGRQMNQTVASYEQGTTVVITRDDSSFNTLGQSVHYTQTTHSPSPLAGEGRGEGANRTSSTDYTLNYDRHGRAADTTAVTTTDGHTTTVQDRVLRTDNFGRAAETFRTMQDASIPKKLTEETISTQYDSKGRAAFTSTRVHETGEGLDKTYTVETKVKTFDALDRASTLLVTTAEGSKVTAENQTRLYDNQNRVVMTKSGVTESGPNYHRTYDTVTLITAFDSKDRALHILRTTTKDSQAPDKTLHEDQTFTYTEDGQPATIDTVVTESSPILFHTYHTKIENGSFNSLGQATSQKTTIDRDNGSADKVTVTDREGMTYDAQGRLYAYKETHDGVTTVMKATHYDELGRIVQTQEDRTWGDLGGGQITGLDDGWKKGSASITQNYSYDAQGRLAKLTVRATGTGDNAELAAVYGITNLADYKQRIAKLEENSKDSRYKGLLARLINIMIANLKTVSTIDLKFEQSGFQYDSLGRAVGYDQTGTQNAVYKQHYTEHGSFGRKKKKERDVVGLVGTHTAVSGITFDSVGHAAGSNASWSNSRGNYGFSNESRVSYDSRGNKISSRQESYAHYQGHGYTADLFSKKDVSFKFDDLGNQISTQDLKTLYDRQETHASKSRNFFATNVGKITGIFLAAVVTVITGGNVYAGLAFQAAWTAVGTYAMGGSPKDVWRVVGITAGIGLVTLGILKGISWAGSATGNAAGATLSAAPAAGAASQAAQSSVLLNALGNLGFNTAFAAGTSSVVAKIATVFALNLTQYYTVKEISLSSKSMGDFGQILTASLATTFLLGNVNGAQSMGQVMQESLQGLFSATNLVLLAFQSGVRSVAIREEREHPGTVWSSMAESFIQIAFQGKEAYRDGQNSEYLKKSGIDGNSLTPQQRGDLVIAIEGFGGPEAFKTILASKEALLREIDNKSVRQSFNELLNLAKTAFEEGNDGRGGFGAVAAFTLKKLSEEGQFIKEDFENLSALSKNMDPKEKAALADGLKALERKTEELGKELVNAMNTGNLHEAGVKAFEVRTQLVGLKEIMVNVQIKHLESQIKADPKAHVAFSKAFQALKAEILASLAQAEAAAQEKVLINQKFDMAYVQTNQLMGLLQSLQVVFAPSQILTDQGPVEVQIHLNTTTSSALKKLLKLLDQDKDKELVPLKDLLKQLLAQSDQSKDVAVSLTVNPSPSGQIQISYLKGSEALKSQVSIGSSLSEQKRISAIWETNINHDKVFAASPQEKTEERAQLLKELEANYDRTQSLKEEVTRWDVNALHTVETVGQNIKMAAKNDIFGKFYIGLWDTGKLAYTKVTGQAPKKAEGTRLEQLLGEERELLRQRETILSRLAQLKAFSKGNPHYAQAKTFHAQAKTLFQSGRYNEAEQKALQTGWSLDLAVAWEHLQIREVEVGHADLPGHIKNKADQLELYLDTTQSVINRFDEKSATQHLFSVKADQEILEVLIYAFQERKDVSSGFIFNETDLFKKGLSMLYESKTWMAGGDVRKAETQFQQGTKTIGQAWMEVEKKQIANAYHLNRNRSHNPDTVEIRMGLDATRGTVIKNILIKQHVAVPSEAGVHVALAKGEQSIDAWDQSDSKRFIRTTQISEVYNPHGTLIHRDVHINDGLLSKREDYPLGKDGLVRDLIHFNSLERRNSFFQLSTGAIGLSDAMEMFDLAVSEQLPAKVLASSRIIWPLIGAEDIKPYFMREETQVDQRIALIRKAVVEKPTESFWGHARVVGETATSLSLAIPGFFLQLGAHPLDTAKSLPSMPVAIAQQTWEDWKVNKTFAITETAFLFGSSVQAGVKAYRTAKFVPTGGVSETVQLFRPATVLERSFIGLKEFGKDVGVTTINMMTGGFKSFTKPLVEKYVRLKLFTERTGQWLSLPDTAGVKMVALLKSEAGAISLEKLIGKTQLKDVRIVLETKNITPEIVKLLEKADTQSLLQRNVKVGVVTNNPRSLALAVDSYKYVNKADVKALSGAYDVLEFKAGNNLKRWDAKAKGHDLELARLEHNRAELMSQNLKNLTEREKYQKLYDVKGREYDQTTAKLAQTEAKLRDLERRAGERIGQDGRPRQEGHGISGQDRRDHWESSREIRKGGGGLEEVEARNRSYTEKLRRIETDRQELSAKIERIDQESRRAIQADTRIEKEIEGTRQRLNGAQGKSNSYRAEQEIYRKIKDELKRVSSRVGEERSTILIEKTPQPKDLAIPVSRIFEGPAVLPPSAFDAVGLKAPPALRNDQQILTPPKALPFHLPSIVLDKAIVLRAVSNEGEYPILDAGGSVKSGGRFNKSGSPAIYFSEELSTILSETHAMEGKTAAVVRIEGGKFLDLSTLAKIRAVGLDIESLFHPTDHAYAQSVGELARSRGYDGIFVLSRFGGDNVVIFDTMGKNVKLKMIDEYQIGGDVPALRRTSLRERLSSPLYDRGLIFLRPIYQKLRSMVSDSSLIDEAHATTIDRVGKVPTASGSKIDFFVGIDGKAVPNIAAVENKAFYTTTDMNVVRFSQNPFKTSIRALGRSGGSFATTVEEANQFSGFKIANFRLVFKTNEVVDRLGLPIGNRPWWRLPLFGREITVPKGTKVQVGSVQPYQGTSGRAPEIFFPKE